MSENLEALSRAHSALDRRARRTRQQLCAALLALLKEKRYKDISVQAIIARADVARSTFYMHYLDKDDLLVGPRGVFADNLKQHQALKLRAEQNSTSMMPTRAWFQHLQAQRTILQIIAADSAMDLAMQTLYQMLHHEAQRKLQPYLSRNTNLAPPSFYIDYVTDALMSLMRWWIKNGMVESPERMDELFQQLVLPGVLTTLKLDVD